MSFSVGSHYQHLWPSGTSRVTTATKPARSAPPGWRYATSPGHGGPPPAPPRGHRAGPELVPTVSMLCGWRNSFQWGSEMVSVVIWCQLSHFVRLQPPPPPPPGGVRCIVHHDCCWLVSHNNSGYVTLPRTKTDFRRRNNENDDIYTNANMCPRITLTRLRAPAIFIRHDHQCFLAFPE